MAMGIDCMGISSMSIEDTTHGIGIDCMGIWFMASSAWVYGYHGHGHLVHGISCIDACHLQKMPHTASVSWA